MKLLSHDDKLLSEHISGLKKIVDVINCEKYQSLFPCCTLQKILDILVSYHDLGKASIYFQVYLANSLFLSNTPHKYYSIEELNNFLEKNSTIILELQNNFELKNHSLLGALMAYYDNNLENFHEEYKLLIFLILLCHHGDLKSLELVNFNILNRKCDLIKISEKIDYNKMTKMLNKINLTVNYANIENIFCSFSVRSLRNNIEEIKKKKSCETYLKTLYLYSILLSADKGDVMLKEDFIFERIKFIPDIIDKYKNKLIIDKEGINNKREEAYKVCIENLSNNLDKNFFTITLPTGLGKTLISLNIAFKLKYNRFTNFRIIYCLPFTSIIDQNAKIIEDIITLTGNDKSILNIDHHLNVPDEKIGFEDLYSEWEYFTDGWQNEITITTFVQLWDSIFTCKNKNSRKFHNLVNSIIILDEVQQIKPELIKAFEYLAKYLNKYFNTQFIFVSATQPIILQGKVFELTNSKKQHYFYENINRTRIKKDLIKSKKFTTVEELSETVIERYKKKSESTLIICNTIKYSQCLFNILKKNNILDCKIFYLSAAVIPYSREKIIDKVIDCLKRKEKIILVSTQVVEAGVDIDFELVYRDFAPMSSINQAAGRCNRNNSMGDKLGDVVLFDSGKKIIYDPNLLEITEEIIYRDNADIEEKNYHLINQEYFQKVSERIQKLSNTSESLISDIQKLDFENICRDTNYRLIDKRLYTNKIFIPLNEEADKLWGKFFEYLKIENRFEKKRKIKYIFPKLSKFSVDIPNYIFSPDNDQKGKSIIRFDQWEEIYDKILGYKFDINNNSKEILKSPCK